MARTVEIALDPQMTDEVLEEIGTIDGVTGIRLQRGASLKPAGDVLTLDLTNPAMIELMKRLELRGLGDDPRVAISTAEVLSSISAPSIGKLTRERSDASWEEMEASLLKESNTTPNTLLLMLCAGVLSTIGIATDALHVVLGAMLIAPGFEPLTRIGLGVVARSKASLRGLADFLRLYLALVVGVGLTTLTLLGLDKMSLTTGAAYLPMGSLANYWTSLSVPSTLVSGAAAIAGAVLIASNRSVLTLGVMAGLSLIPALTLVVMGAILGEWTLSALGLMRWLVDVALVVTLSIAVFAWKWWSVQRRRMLL